MGWVDPAHRGSPHLFLIRRAGQLFRAVSRCCYVSPHLPAHVRGTEVGSGSGELVKAKEAAFCCRLKLPLLKKISKTQVNHRT